jgi:hypothetical protein
VTARNKMSREPAALAYRESSDSIGKDEEGPLPPRTLLDRSATYGLHGLPFEVGGLQVWL